MFNSIFESTRQAYDMLNIRDRATADIAKSGSENSMFGSILGSIGGFFQKMNAASQAEDYAAQVEQARMISRQNAMDIAEAQQKSNLEIAEFQAKLYRQNANYLQGTAINNNIVTGKQIGRAHV